MKSDQTGIMIFCFYTVLIQILIFHSCIESIIPICPRIHPTFLSDSIMLSFVIITDDKINALSLISADICLLDVNHPTGHGLLSKEGRLSFDQQPSAANSSSRRNEVQKEPHQLEYQKKLFSRSVLQHVESCAKKEY